MIGRFLGHPQVRDRAITLFQSEFQVSAVTRGWTASLHTMRYGDCSVTGNRMLISIRTRLLLQSYIPAASLFLLVYTLPSNFLKLWCLVIAHTPTCARSAKYLSIHQLSAFSFPFTPPHFRTLQDRKCTKISPF